MPGACEEYEVLISGRIDGELGEDERSRLEAHLEGCSVCRRELAHLERLAIGTSRLLNVDEPPDEVWDAFLDGVYNRAERQTGWILVIVGVLGLSIAGITFFELHPAISPLTKILLTVPAVGLLILFLSVLRQRMRAAKTDRYSREIQR
jgi:anti-sigma factor RsiW